MGMIALPAMLKRGYSKGLALGCILAGGGLGQLIPPAVMLIVYGLVANVSIGKLFAGGLGAGLLLASLYIGYILLRSYLQPHLAPPAPIEERSVPIGQKIAALRGVILPLILVLAVLGSIFQGVATPTEGGRRRRPRRPVERRRPPPTYVAERQGRGPSHDPRNLHDPVDFLRRHGVQQRLYPGRRRRNDRRCDPRSAARSVGHPHRDPGVLHHHGRTHGLARHPPDHRPGGDSNRQGSGIRSHLVRHTIRRQHADRLPVAARGRGPCSTSSRLPRRTFRWATYSAPPYRFAGCSSSGSFSSWCSPRSLCGRSGFWSDKRRGTSAYASKDDTFTLVSRSIN